MAKLIGTKVQVKNYDGTWTDTIISNQVTELSFMTVKGAIHMNEREMEYCNFLIADEGRTWRRK